MFTKSEIKAKLDKRTDLSHNFIIRYQHMVDWINEPLGCHFIDIGCNTGIFDYHLALLGYKIQGVDFCDRAITVATRHGNVEGRLQFRQGDATRLIDPDHHYDAGIACEVLEHIPNYLDALNELRRVVKFGGNIYVSVPREHLAFDKSHVNFFTQNEMQEIILGLGCTPNWNIHPKLDHLIFSFVNTGETQ